MVKVTKGLFEIPARLQGITNLKNKESENEITNAFLSALSVSFDQIRYYNAYINGETPFATHQGVKGLEFPRVMIIENEIISL